MLIHSPSTRTTIYGIVVILSSFSSITAAADSTAKALAFPCYTCHGTDGQGTDSNSPGSIPALSVHNADDLREKLLVFKRDQSDPTIMNRIAKGYTDDEIRRLSEFLGALSDTITKEHNQ